MTAPDNDARFIRGEDYAESPLYGVTIEFPAAMSLSSAPAPANALRLKRFKAETAARSEPA